MGKSIEREATTNYACETINSFLKNNEYRSALLFSSIYLEIRLRTLLTDRMSPLKVKWKETSKKFEKYDLYNLIEFCGLLELISENERKDLDELRDKRNNVAHESRLWRNKPQKNEKNKIERLCNSAIQFLERTRRV